MAHLLLMLVVAVVEFIMLQMVILEQVALVAVAQVEMVLQLMA